VGQLDTRTRIERQCIREALAIQDRLPPGVRSEGRLARLVRKVRAALLPDDPDRSAEFPPVCSSEYVLFSPFAAGPPFALWFEPAGRRYGAGKESSYCNAQIPEPA
jgi:hypothetical protein